VGAPGQAELLGIWERGEGQWPWRRALTLLSGIAPGTPDDELASMPIGRRDAALLDLREQLFGNAFTGITACPDCGEEIELTFEASEVRRTAAHGDEGPFTISTGRYEVTFRLPDTADLMHLDGASGLAAARAELLARCVTSALRDGAAIVATELPPELVDVVTARMSEADPQADVAFEVACPSCAHAWLEPFDVVTFLWTELASWARSLLFDVHQLASAYAWSEHDVLRLSPARRNAYLEMLQ
jgi:hypothetical protein